MPRPLILDFDASLVALADAVRIDLSAWQERIRFGCSLHHWSALEASLHQKMPESYGTVCLGSGDFHHLSHLLIKACTGRQPFDVVVFDNHPDNMRYPFGIHCGSWVYHAARLPAVARIHVLGITSDDVGAAHAWENHLGGLWQGKVHYWTIGVPNSWARVFGLGRAFHAFKTRQEMLQAFGEELARLGEHVYLSIDKDVLDVSEVRTNWDQGCLLVEDLCGVIAGLNGRIIGSDITGEISAYRYVSRWKNFLSDLDGQSDVSDADLAGFQERQTTVTQRLIDAIENAAQR